MDNSIKGEVPKSDKNTSLLKRNPSSSKKKIKFPPPVKKEDFHLLKTLSRSMWDESEEDDSDVMQGREKRPLGGSRGRSSWDPQANMNRGKKK